MPCASNVRSFSNKVLSSNPAVGTWKSIMLKLLKVCVFLRVIMVSLPLSTGTEVYSISLVFAFIKSINVYRIKESSSGHSSFSIQIFQPVTINTFFNFVKSEMGMTLALSMCKYVKFSALSRYLIPLKIIREVRMILWYMMRNCLFSKMKSEEYWSLLAIKYIYF